VSFTITAPNNDKTAPVTTQSLDPAAPGAGKTYSGPVTVKFSALDQAPGGPAAKTVEVDAEGNNWLPSPVSLVAGDRIQWNFRAAQTSQPHDVWLVSPGGNPAEPTKESPGLFVLPGDPPVVKTLSAAGTYTFLCKIHASYDAPSQMWFGMVGTANVTAAPTGEQPSGVDFTEYRVNDGAWAKATNTTSANPFTSEVKVEAEGQHTVQFRSVDKAGNAETAKSVAFAIDIPEPGTPVIEAFADPASGEAPLQTRFSASGYDPDGGQLSYKWEFEDGVVLGKAVARTFTKPGSYTAKVTATDPKGEKSTKEVTVTVTAPGVQPPTVELAADRTSGAAPLMVGFTATGADPDGNPALLKYHWDFGDDTPGSYAQNPTHVYLEPGTFTAKVTVTDGSGATASKSVAITVAPAPGNLAPTILDAVSAPGESGDPLQVQFTVEAKDSNGDPITFEWDFDDGSAKQSGGKVSHTYARAGTYNAKVTASDGKATSTKTVTVTVALAANVAPTLDILADPVRGSAPLVVRFSSQATDPDGTDPLKYTWAFGDGSFSAEPNPVHTYVAAGVYTATLTVEDRQGGKTTKTLTITVTQVSGGAPQPKAPDAAPEQAPWFGVSEPVKTSVAGFAKSGLAVRVTCTEAMSGKAKITVSSKVAKKLKLKSRTLASVKVTCADAGSKALKLKASKAVKKALAKAKGSLKVTLSVSLKAKGESSKNSTRSVTLSRR
jgi:PKD repeat protein